MSRCVAIAAHGKRCQQSPFRGSPYCWHHTQSRKIWAPSRPLATSAGRAIVLDPIEAAERRTGADRRERGDRREGWAAESELARRLLEALGVDRAEEILEFLEAPADGAYLMVKDEGGILTERSVSERPERRRRPA